MSLQEKHGTTIFFAIQECLKFMNVVDDGERRVLRQVPSNYLRLVSFLRFELESLNVEPRVPEVDTVMRPKYFNLNLEPSCQYCTETADHLHKPLRCIDLR
jgi:hypothetical protein